MGQTLSEPIKDKHTTDGHSSRFIYAASAMQGWRIAMEDAHTTELNVTNHPNSEIGFFAVYDGHGGSTVARYAGANLHKLICNQESFQLGDYPTAMKRGFLQIDTDMRADQDFNGDPAGCTAVSALITDTQIIVANAGDSRAVLGKNGHTVALSEDHKPGNPVEKDRITNAGGFVEFGRVNGNLALSRALGDFDFKQSPDLPPEKQIVTADPDVLVLDVTPECEFMIIACDGIWDCISNTDAVAYVRHQLAHGKSVTQVCEEIMEHCVAPSSDMGGVGCDNMTVMIVGFLHGRSIDDWYTWIRDAYLHSDPVHSITFARGVIDLNPDLPIPLPDGCEVLDTPTTATPYHHSSAGDDGGGMGSSHVEYQHDELVVEEEEEEDDEHQHSS